MKLGKTSVPWLREAKRCKRMESMEPRRPTANALLAEAMGSRYTPSCTGAAAQDFSFARSITLPVSVKRIEREISLVASSSERPPSGTPFMLTPGKTRLEYTAEKTRLTTNRSARSRINPAAKASKILVTNEGEAEYALFIISDYNTRNNR